MIAGADACRLTKKIAGWAVVELRENHPPTVLFEKDLSTYMVRQTPELLGIDIPIGLPAKGERRRADIAARAFLSSRRSTVFFTPSREVLTQPTYSEALRIESISAQAYSLSKRILEVETLAQQHGGRVIEVHPEVSFKAIAGQALASKRSWVGINERIAALHRAGIEIPKDLSGDEARIPADDILDAAIVAVTARCVAKGTGLILPQERNLEDRLQRDVIWMPEPTSAQA